jgi:hypothetical protein
MRSREVSLFWYMALSSPQKKLITSYFAVTVIYSVSITGLHLLLKILNLAPSLLVYIPFILIGSIIIYYKYFREKIRRVQFRGAGVTTVPTVYYMAMLAAPFLPLNGISLLTDRIVEINSINRLRETTETFLSIPKLEPDYKLFFDSVSFETEMDEDGKVDTRFNYTATMPVAFNNKAWIVIKNLKYSNKYESTAVLLEMQKNFYDANRKRVIQFPFDSIQYVEKTDGEVPLALLQSKRVKPVDLIFINPSLTSISSLRIWLCWIMGGTYFVLSLFFIMTVATGHYEEIVND